MKFVLRNEQILRNAMDYLYGLEIDPEKPQQLIIKNFNEIRTAAQNALYWSWLRIISKDTGNSVKVLHSFYGDRFLEKELGIIAGKKVEAIKSTTELSPKEFNLYLQQIEADATNFFGINLPRPGEMEW